MQLTKKKAIQVFKLIEQWTRAEIMARLAPISTANSVDYYKKKLELENKIRKLIFEEDDLLKLSEKWQMFVRHKNRERTEYGRDLE